jgi:hypothetical protein
MASWGDEYPESGHDVHGRQGVDWGSLLVIVLLIFGLFLEALWVS